MFIRRIPTEISVPEKTFGFIEHLPSFELGPLSEHPVYKKILIVKTTISFLRETSDILTSAVQASIEMFGHINDLSNLDKLPHKAAQKPVKETLKEATQSSQLLKLARS